MSSINNKLSYLSETKEQIKNAIIGKGVEIQVETSFRAYADKITEIEIGGENPVSIKRNCYITASRMLFTIAYQKRHNLYPDLARILICYHWSNGDTQIYKVGGPNNYKVELQTGKVYSGNDTTQVTDVTHHWSAQNKEDAPENDEDTEWNLGFGIATTYMSGNEYDQTIEITGAYHTPAYILLDGCSVHLSCLSGIGESAILDAVNGGKYLLSTQEDVNVLNLIKPKYIKGLAIQFDSLSDIFPDSIKYLSLESVITTSSIFVPPRKLEELENIEAILNLGLTAGEYDDFGNTHLSYLGETISFNDSHYPFLYFRKIGIQTAPNLIFDGNDSASFLFDACWNLKHIQTIEFKNCTDYDLSYMFVRCYSLICPELFDTAAAKNMKAMFLSCYNLETIPPYNTDNVNNLSYMLSECYCLKSVPAINMTNVTDANKMLEKCSSLEQLHMKNIGCNLDISASTKFTAEALVEVMNNLKTLPGKTLTMGAANLAKLTDEQKAIATGKGWTLA